MGYMWDIYIWIYNPVIMSSHWRTIGSFFKMGTLHQQPVCGIGNWLTGAKRREFSGMIHFITSNVIIPATPQQPIHSLLILSTSKLKICWEQIMYGVSIPVNQLLVLEYSTTWYPVPVPSTWAASMCQIQRHGIGLLPRITCHYFKIWFKWFVTSGMPVWKMPKIQFPMFRILTLLWKENISHHYNLY